MPRRAATVVPDDLDVLLLRACFLPADEARHVWDTALAPRLSIEDLGSASHDLLPLLHRRLAELDRRPPSFDKLQGIRRRLWVRNEQRMRSVHEASQRLHDAGVPVGLLGSAAVLVGHHGRLDLRSLRDVEVLVAADDELAAQATLRHSGWRSGRRWHGGALLDLAGTQFTDAGGQTLNLRCSPSPPYDDAVDHMRTVVVGGIDHRIACGADLVLNIVLDGARLSGRDVVRWRADALTVLLGADGIDWDRFVGVATARRRGRTVSEALDELHRVVPLDVPASVWGGLAAATEAAPSPLFDRHPGGRPTLVGAYARRSADTGLLDTIRGIPSFLCEVWDLSSPKELPAETARRLRGRLRQTTTT